MCVTENVNPNEGPAGGVSTENVPGGAQYFNPEQSAPIAQVIQQDGAESGFEDKSKTSLRYIIVSSLVFLSFAALLIWTYFTKIYVGLSGFFKNFVITR